MKKAVRAAIMGFWRGIAPSSSLSYPDDSTTRIVYDTTNI